MDYERPQFFRVMQYARRADRDVVDVVSGNPDWEPPDGLREGLREYADRPPEDFQYPPSVGLTALRAEIADRRGVDRERVLVTNGAGEANHLAMAGGLERYGGTEIVLTDPVYPYYAGRANFLGADTALVPVGDDGHLDPADVRETVTDETAVVVVNTPNNPTGAVYDEATMAALVDVVEDHDALLVSDEVYDHFDFSGRFSSALAQHSPNVVVTNSFSKSLAITGFRVGYAIFPPEDESANDEAAADLDLHARARTRHMLTNVTGSRPAQYAVLRSLQETSPAYFAEKRRLLADRADRFCAALEAAGATYNHPEGAFYVMARFEDFPGTFENVFELIDEAGVAAMPGEAFGDSRREWIRFALVTPDVEDAATRLGEFFE